MRNYYVYIITNKPRGVLYVGVTNSLPRRIEEHKNKASYSFSSKYNLTKLVYFESTDSIEVALEGEKKIKNWHRDWKINLIEKENPEWKDLSDDL